MPQCFASAKALLAATLRLQVLIRPHLQTFAFPASLFEQLRAQLHSGALGPERSRLSQPPAPLPASSESILEPELASPTQRAQWRERGRQALRAGEVGVLILAGGMATRFGGGAKACFPLQEGPTAPSFLAFKLAQLARISRELNAAIPVVVMDSFATRECIGQELEQRRWMGIAPALRHRFSQSLMPRLQEANAEPLLELDPQSSWPDSILYCAPGHGDTLRRLKESGSLKLLTEQGVGQLLVSNVDNLQASLDPLLVGAHLWGVNRGFAVSVEAVRRKAHEAGGCVAELPQGAAIVESFRLPPQTELDDYPDFNTNTLWVDLQALDPLPNLGWHPVRRSIACPDGQERPCIQFEQLIGELSEHRPTQVLRVPRKSRFLPIKTREALRNAQPTIQELIAQCLEDIS